MKKKLWISIAIIVAVLAVLFVPVPRASYDDGGTREWVALTYKIVDWNKLTDDGSGSPVLYEKVRFYGTSDRNKSIDELWEREASLLGKEAGQGEQLLYPVGYDEFSNGIYLCTDVYRTNQTPTHGRGTIAIPTADIFELSDYDILLCNDGCDQTDVVSRRFWGYAPSWRIDKYVEFTADDGWSYYTRRYINEVPENIKAEMISQGAPESVTNPRDYIYLLTLDENHYAYIHLKGKEGVEPAINESKLADNIVKSAIVTLSELYLAVSDFLEAEMHRVFDPYYDIQSLTISHWIENGNEATFYYKMTHKYYNTDPDTVDYIKKAKENNSPYYEKMKEEYLAEKEANFEFKAVLTENGVELYSNDSPNGVNWQPVKIDDYVLKGN